MKIMSIKGGGGGVRRLMEKSILNFYFDYLKIDQLCLPFPPFLSLSLSFFTKKPVYIAHNN